jgi:hypothetical protein
MPISASDFTTNSLSGSITTAEGHANVSLLSIPYALEGPKSFVIKIRKGSISGDVLATSTPITLQDTSAFVSLTANLAIVPEGNIVSFSLVTANAINNANLYYSVFPVTANVTAADFFGSNVGRATIINNQASFALFANADLSLMDEVGETFRVQIRTSSATGNIIHTTSNILISDNSKTYTFVSLTTNRRGNVFYGGGDNGPIVFTLTTINTNGSNLYYSMTGNAAGNIFTTANAGYFIVPANNSSKIQFTASYIPPGETRTFQLLFKETPSSPTLITSNVITVIGYIPPKPTSIEYTVIGGGGRSGYGGSGSGGGGGGGAGIVATTGPVTAGATYSITIGAGGGTISTYADATPSSFSGTGISTTAYHGGSGGDAPGGGGTAGGGNPAVGAFPGGGGNGAPGPASGTPGGNGSGGGGGGGGGAGTYPTNPSGRAGGTGGSYSPYGPNAPSDRGTGPGPSGSNDYGRYVGVGGMVQVRYGSTFAALTTTGATVTTSGGYQVYVWTSPGSFTV